VLAWNQLNSVIYRDYATIDAAEHNLLGILLTRPALHTLRAYGIHRFTHARFGAVELEHTPSVPDGNAGIRTVICIRITPPPSVRSRKQAPNWRVKHEDEHAHPARGPCLLFSLAMRTPYDVRACALMLHCGRPSRRYRRALLPFQLSCQKKK